MTPREMRLLRLARLRERQHDVAALYLRAARMHLAAAESTAANAQERTRVAYLCRLTAATQGDANQWLLACAESQVSLLTAERHHARLEHAKAVAKDAAEAETAARRERKQMEATLAMVHREYAQKADRREQSTLDEIARLQRAGSTKHLTWRRDL